MKFGLIVGSNRKASWNRKVAEVVQTLFPQEHQVEFIEVNHLSYYNEDLEENPPQEWVDFREAIAAQDGIVFFTPEYNHSFSAQLKNAIDIGSRPFGQSKWNGKVAGIVSASIGPGGGSNANLALRDPLVFNDVITVMQPVVFLGRVNEYFDQEGHMVADTKAFLQTFVDRLVELTEKVR
ncbi:MAG: NAD(P)H-dependent oxidoreductase [Tissierellia bacterium]|nr:NAD(P)H-dependent oxidoreductase [Tissierellia bacterium]